MRRLFGVILLTSIGTAVVFYILWRYTAIPELFTPQLFIPIATIMVTIAAPFLTFSLGTYASKPRIQVKVVKCQHEVRHSLAKKEATGTSLSVKLLIKSKKKKTSIDSTRLELKSRDYPYKKQDRESSIFVVPGDDSRYYEHRYFISKYEILDLQLKCVLWLVHTHGEKKINLTSNRR